MGIMPAIMAMVVDAGGHRDRPFDRFDDVGEADRGGRARQAKAAAGAARCAGALRLQPRSIRASHADYRAKFPELESLWPKHMSA